MSFGFSFSLPAYQLRGLRSGGGNNPFNQSGPTLDLSFVDGATNVGNQLGADTYTLDTNFITPQYQVAAQYAVWVAGSGLTQRNFADIVTFSRGSTATYFNSAGTLTTAAINEARFDFNPSTLAAQGLLIEEQRTNSIRNNTMQGAVAGTPGTLPTNWVTGGGGLGTLTREIIGTGTSNGITYIDIRFSGTTSTTGFTIGTESGTSGPAASVGQTWTMSNFFAMVGGSITNINALRAVQILGRDAGGASSGDTFSGADIKSSVTSTLTRFTVSGTVAQATTATLQPMAVTFNFASGVAIDITLRIGLPQLEQGAFATSVIPTTGAAATRNQDQASVNTLSPWWNASEGTFYVEGSAGSLANSPIFVMPHDGTSNNYLNSPLLTTAGLARLAGVVGGAAWTNVNTANSTTANTTFKSASAFKAGDQAICLNAGTVGTGVNASLPVVTTVKLGDWRTSGNSINGYLRRISYYPRRLSNAELQSITT